MAHIKDSSGSFWTGSSFSPDQRHAKNLANMAMLEGEMTAIKNNGYHGHFIVLAEGGLNENPLTEFDL